MVDFDEAAAVEAPKEGSPEYLIMVCQQHMAWLTVYAEGMTQSDWRDMQDRLVSQIGKLVADFAALAALKGRDLACFCPLDQACHADVLLEIANPHKGR